jgi:hypothetical protein
MAAGLDTIIGWSILWYSRMLALYATLIRHPWPTGTLPLRRCEMRSTRPRTSFAPAFLLLGLCAASVTNAAGFDTPENAVQALQQAYTQKDADLAVAALDFVEEGRQMLQETNPLLANDGESIKRAAELLEQSFRNELRTKGFPEFGKLKCAFVGKTQIAPGLVKLTEQCELPTGAKSVQDLIVKQRDSGWKVVLASPVF